jgi:hypothetical protein
VRNSDRLATPAVVITLLLVGMVLVGLTIVGVTYLAARASTPARCSTCRRRWPWRCPG